MPTSSDSLGSYLRAEREQRRVSLQEISAATKIQVKFLRALEEDAYDQLPPAPLYVVGFLRAYAQCLSLDPEEVVTAYSQHCHVQEGPQGQRLPAPPQERRRKRLGLVSFGVVVALGIVALLVLRGLRLDSEERLTVPVISETLTVAPLTEVQVSQPVRSTPVPSQTAFSTPASAPSTVPIVLPPPVELELAGTLPAGQSSPTAAVESVAALPAAEHESVASTPPLVLRVEALEDTWLRVEIDGNARHALLLVAGKDIHWEATKRFVLTVGNVEGTRLLLNDRSIPLPPTRSNVVRDFLLTSELLH